MKLLLTRKDKRNLRKVFKNFGRPKTDEEIFYDLCFCICAPQTTFKNNKKVIEQLWRDDSYNIYTDEKVILLDNDRTVSLKTWLEIVLKPTRFYRQKTKYLVEAKENFRSILYTIKGSICPEHYACDGCPISDRECINGSYRKREWLVKNVKGLGMKTASHFLRNLGDTELAIIDTHILKFLIYDIVENSLDPKFIAQFLESKKIFTLPNPNSKRKYLELEKRFQEIAKENNLTPAELDAYIWQKYSKTPWEEFKY